MHILFIYPDICASSGRFQQGIGSLSALLKENGHKTSLLHIEKKISKKFLYDKISELQPDIIGFSTTSNQYPVAKLLAGWIKERFKIIIICGGLHPTVAPDEVMASKVFDAICIGESEYSLLEICDRIDQGKNFSNIPNLWVNIEGSIQKNSPRPPIEKLDELPFPDRDLFDYDKLLKKYEHTAESHIAEIMTGRGCPFQCSYCFNNHFPKLYGNTGQIIRRRSVNNVLSEIRYLVKKYDIHAIAFDDDTFTMNPSWISDFCEKYSTEFNIPFHCNAYPTTLKQKTVDLLKMAGCISVAIGIESGNEWLRNNILKRQITNKQIEESFKLIRNAGISTHSFNMVGLPFETPEMAEDTIKLNKIISPDHIQVSIFYPYPGTDLYDISKKQGWLTEKQKSSYFDEGSTLEMPNFSSDQITRYYRKLHLMSIDNLVGSRYSRIQPLYKLVKKTFGDTITYRISILARKILFKY